MARQTTVRLTDDLDGSDAQATVRFGWDGVSYEIDLNAEHAEQFSAAVRPYLDGARRVGPTRRRGERTSTGRGAASGRRVGEQAAIRDWARSNGFQLADRGRIPGHVLDAYRAARQQGAPATSAEPAPAASQTRVAPARKATGTKRTAAKPTTKKSTAKKSTARKATAKRTTAKRTTGKTATGKRTSARQAVANKTVAKKVAAKKVAAKKPAAKKPAAKKPAAKKAATRKATRRTGRPGAAVAAS